MTVKGIPPWNSYTARRRNMKIKLELVVLRFPSGFTVADIRDFMGLENTNSVDASIRYQLKKMNNLEKSIIPGTNSNLYRIALQEQT